MELPREVIETLLERWPVARLATRTSSGRPHTVPIVFAHSDGDLWSPIDGKPKRGGELARIRNIAAHPDVAVLLDHYEEDWQQLWWLRLDGRASVAEGRELGADPELAPAAIALREKYPQYGTVPLFQDPPRLMRISVDRRASWCAGPDALETLRSLARL